MEMLYFAYGSNMSHQQMCQRCPGSTFIGAVQLHGYQLVYDGFSKRWTGAVANIVKSVASDAEAWGGLFKINRDNLTALDRCEGYSTKVYDRGEFTVIGELGSSHLAVAYYREGEKRGEPTDGYRDIVIEGARECRLPDKYIGRHL